MDEESRLAKLKAYRERDAARKREQRRLSKIERQRMNESSAPLSAPSSVNLDHDINQARVLVQRLLQETQKQVDDLIQKAREEGQLVAMQLESEAKLVASQLETEAMEKAKALETQAKEKARTLELEAEMWARTTKEKARAFVMKELEIVPDSIPSSMRDDPDRIISYIEELPDVVAQPPLDPVEVQRKRKRLDDARRARKSYYKRKQDAELETRELVSNIEEERRDVGTSRGASSLSSARFVAKYVIDTFDSRTDRCTEDFRKKVWSRIWKNRRVEPYIPNVFRNAKEASAMIGMVDKLQGALQHTKKAARKDHHAAKYTLLSGVVDQSTLDNREVTTVSSLLKIKKKNLFLAAERRTALDLDKTVTWPMGKRKAKTGSCVISTEIKEVVVDWWTNESRTLPGRKDVIRLRVARNDYEVHIIHILDETQTEFYNRFKERYPDIQISQRAFEYLKPYFVRVLKDRYVCCCQSHVQMEYIKEALNTMRVKLHRTQVCTCRCLQVCGDINSQTAGDGTHCKGSLNIFQSVTDLWESCVCPKEIGKAWHKLDCINGLCPRCGIKKLQFCPSVEVGGEGNLEVPWRAFERVEVYPNGVTPRGRKVSNPKRIKVVHQKTKPASFVEFVKAKLPAYIKHNFCAKWQTRCYQEALKVFPPGVVMSVIDFAENYSFQIQNEIQSMHWHSDQVTLLIHITYRHDMDKPVRVDPVTNLPVRDIVKNYHVYVSDDKEHDVLFVHHCLDKHAAWLEEQKTAYYEHWVWSDGASSQFKCARNFYYVARHHVTHERPMRWFFFGSGHGKGEHDGAGGVIKRALRFEQLRQDGCKLQNAEDVTNFLKESLGTEIGISRRPLDPKNVAPVDRNLPLDLCRSVEGGDPSRTYRRYNRKNDGCSKRYFWLIGKSEVNRNASWGCKTLPGSRKLHAFVGGSSRSITTLKTRRFACVCPACIDGDDQNCENTEWCGRWISHELTPTNLVNDTMAFETMGLGETDEVPDEGDEDLYSSAEDKASLVQRGDNFAVYAEPDSDDEHGINQVERFFIMKCDEPSHILQMDIRNEHWSGAAYKKGDIVLSGKYYQQVKEGDETKYLLLHDRASAVVYARSVLYVNFPMTPYRGGKGPNQRYKIEEEHLDAILSSLANHDCLDEDSTHLDIENEDETEGEDADSEAASAEGDSDEEE